MSPGAVHSISPPPPLGAAEIVSGSAHSRLGQPAGVKMVPTFKKVAVGAGKFEMRKILMPASKTTASSTSALGGQCCHLPSPVKIFRLIGLYKLWNRWEEKKKGAVVRTFITRARFRKEVTQL